MNRVVLLAVLPLLVGCQDNEPVIQEATAAVTQARITPCSADQLVVTVGEIDAGMGHRHLPVEVALKGNGPCLLGAWPDIVLTPQNRAGGIRVDREPTPEVPPADVRLEAGERAAFVLGWSVIPVEYEGETECAAFEGWMLRRSDASQTPQIDTQIQACGRRITVSPFLLQARNGDAATKPS